MSQPVYDALLALFFVVHIPITLSLIAVFTICYYLDGTPFKLQHLLAYLLWPIIAPLLVVKAVVKSGWRPTQESFGG